MPEKDILGEEELLEDIGLGLEAYKELYAKGLELIKSEPRPKKLLLDILDEYKRKLDDMPAIDLSRSGWHKLPDELREKVKSLVLFGTQAVLVRENAELMEKLGKANENYRHLIGIISHEFKNSLTSMNGYTELIEKRIADRKYDSLAELNENVRRLSANLQSLVDTLFSMLLIEEGQLRLENNFFDLFADALEPVLAELQLRLKNESMKVKLEAAEGKNIILGDEKLFQIVFHNLLVNAIQYGKKGTFIKIKIDRYDNKTDIIVSNRGCGLKKEELNRVFDKFSRFHSKKEDNNLGVGLFAVKNIIELHRGTIRAEITGNGWIRFVISLPFAKNKT